MRKNNFYNFGVSVLMLLLFSAPVHASELAGYWNFDEESGETIFDLSGNHNNGQLIGASRSVGKFGAGLNLSGEGGALIPHSLSLDSMPDGFTLAAWIYPTEFPDYTTIFWKTDRNNRVDMLHFQVDGKLYGAMNQEKPSGGFEGISDFVVPLNEWHHAAWTFDNSVQKFYLDGEEVFSEAYQSPWAGNDENLLLGYHPEVNSANFRGMIDEARFYNGALSQTQIQFDMQNPIVTPEPLSAALFLLGGSFMVFNRYRCKNTRHVEWYRVPKGQVRILDRGAD